MECEVLRVQMFGKFSVYYGPRSIVFHKAASAKTVRLLQMLLLAGNHGIAKAELIDSLYSWDECNSSSNRNKNLNKLIYRLRENLTANGLPLYRGASAHEPNGYLERDHYEEALKVYNDTMELYAREMGIPPSEDNETEDPNLVPFA